MKSAAGWPIIGQTEAVTLLRRAIGRDGISHAYLIAGPAGIGKSTLASAFAQAVSCQHPDRPDPSVPCGACLACRKIGRGTHPDVQRYDLEWQRRMTEKRAGQNTTLTIETVRQAAADAALRPMEAPRRFIIIGDADAMQGVAQEALLKTLEEPPPAVVMMLLANEPDALLPTIQSRCQRILLGHVPVGEIQAALLSTGLDEATSREIAVLAAGVPGWAIRAAADPDVVAASRQATERALDWITSSPYERLVHAIKLGDAFTKRRAEIRADVEATLAVWRDLLLLGAQLEDLMVHQSAIGRLRDLSTGWEMPRIAHAIVAIQQCLRDLDANVRPRLALESMVLAWPEVASAR